MSSTPSTVPDDILLHILNFCSRRTVLAVCFVCRDWHSLVTGRTRLWAADGIQLPRDAVPLFTLTGDQTVRVKICAVGSDMRLLRDMLLDNKVFNRIKVLDIGYTEFRDLDTMHARLTLPRLEELIVPAYHGSSQQLLRVLGSQTLSALVKVDLDAFGGNVSWDSETEVPQLDNVTDLSFCTLNAAAATMLLAACPFVTQLVINLRDTSNAGRLVYPTTIRKLTTLFRANRLQDVIAADRLSSLKTLELNPEVSSQNGLLFQVLQALQAADRVEVDVRTITISSATTVVTVQVSHLFNSHEETAMAINNWLSKGSHGSPVAVEIVACPHTSVSNSPWSKTAENHQTW